MTRRTGALALSAALLLAGCDQERAGRGRAAQLDGEVRKLREENESLRREQAESSRESAELQGVLNEVQEGLERVRKDELKLLRASLQRANEGGVASGQKEEMLGEIESIREALKQNRAKLDALEEKSRGQGDRLKAVEGLVVELKRSLDEKEATIAVLQTTVSQLQEAVSQRDRALEERQRELREAQAQLQEKEELLRQREAEANKVWLMIASKETLRRHGLIERRGTILGLGGSWALTGRFDPELFETFDRRQRNRIDFEGDVTTAMILTDHPRDAWYVRPRDSGLTLFIKDPERFWSRSRALIVMAD